MIEIREVQAEVVQPTRQQVLRPNQSIAQMLWAHDLDPDTRHLAAVLGEEIVGIVTAYPAVLPEMPDRDAWQFRGMATAPEMRGRGIGTLLIERCLGLAKDAQAELLWCDARLSAMRFYEKLGFLSIGEAFEKPHAGPHWRMYRWIRDPKRTNGL